MEMFDQIFPYALLAVWLIIIIWPEREDTTKLSRREIRLLRTMKRLEDSKYLCQDERICYDAFKGMPYKDFAKLPQEIKMAVPDKCRWCMWADGCDPLEMAVAFGEKCGCFAEKKF